MNSIDEDAINVLGIKKEVWMEFRKMTEKCEQDYLPNFLEAETEAREASIDKEAFIRHKQAMAKRWFGYYRKCQDQKKKMSLIDQYNKIAQQRQRS